jgi:hypothetical protein
MAQFTVYKNKNPRSKRRLTRCWWTPNPISSMTFRRG